MKNKHIEMILALGIIFLLLFFNIFSSMAVSTNLAQRSKAITFQSYIDFEYDISSLNEPLEIDVSITVPITVKYWTDLPLIFPNMFRIRNMILFGQPIGPMQKINLELLESPEWANIYLSSPEIITDIPFEGEGPVEIDTILIISPGVDAPAESYRIDIKATCESMKRLNGFSYQESIEFTPQYIPVFSATVSNRSVNTHQDKNTIIPIKVTNFANKISSIKPSIVDNISDFSIKLNPPSLVLDIGGTGTINLEVVPSSDFRGFKTLQIDFIMEQYPYRSNSASSTSSVFIDLYYEPEDTENDDFNLYVIFGIVLLIAIISFFIFIRYKGG